MMKVAWGFECKCKACNDEVLDAKLVRVNELRDIMSKLGNEKDIEGIITAGHELIGLMEELDDSQRFVSLVYYDMFQLSICKREYFEVSCKFIKLAHQKNLDYFGCDCAFSRELALLAEHPEVHENFLGLDRED